MENNDKKKKILVVEDERNIAQVLAYNIRKAMHRFRYIAKLLFYTFSRVLNSFLSDFRLFFRHICSRI